MDKKTIFFAWLTIAIMVSLGFTAIVYSRDEAVIYFWNCTASIRVCNLANAFIFFSIATISIMGIIYWRELISILFRKNLDLLSPNTYIAYNIETDREERRQLRDTNQVITKPNKGDLAYHMGMGIQEIEKRFNSIRNGSPAEKKREYTYAREILNTILEREIPKANLVFKDAPQIREKVQSLNRAFNGFGSQLTLSLKKGFREFYQHPEMESFLWGSLENDRSLSGEINSLINELIVLLNQEGMENEKKKSSRKRIS